ncbi:hypothetical protein DK28_0205370 [Peptococcaceae bacterium SCADC1_2_3]|jgi:predicted nucleotidyltransferase|nr:hypothetical protein DK28_0205370 [Peptococcaceae bacterium SCADC1_2_3]KFI36179.1 hypothetical protein HY00_06065 [Peptococcaceae bacterium SCADC1_2_3]
MKIIEKKEKQNLLILQKIFSQFQEIIAVYLFGSYLEKKEQARDVDLAILLKKPVKSVVPFYMKLYPLLAEVFAPLEVDLLFLNSISLPICFEVISTGATLYCSDEDARTDFEYIISGRHMDFKYHLEKARQELYELLKEEAPFV